MLQGLAAALVRRRSTCTLGKQARRHYRNVSNRYIEALKGVNVLWYNPHPKQRHPAVVPDALEPAESLVQPYKSR